MSSKFILALILSVDIIAITIALALGRSPEQYFEEGAFITYISFFQLSAVSLLACIVFGIRVGETRSSGWKALPIIWLIIAIAFIYLSLDEVYEIHENLDFLIHRAFKLRETGFTDRIDDIIVACYGLFGLAILYFQRKEFKKYRDTFPLLKVGFAFMFIMAALDTLTNRKDILQLFISNPYTCKKLFLWLEAIEDSFKIIAEGTFMGALYHCFEITRGLTHGEQSR